VGLLNQRQSKQNLAFAGGVMISKEDVINAGFEIVTCDEKDCGQQAVVVFPDYIKCDEHDKEQKLTELLKEHEEKKKSSLTTPKNRVIL
jgi:hypothetical protein